MTETNLNLSRRKFMMVSSSAIVSPLLLNVAGSMVAGKAVEAKSTKTNISKGAKIYYIGNECIGCHVCKTFCPAQAIHFGDRKNEIDQSKCTHCGTCYRECPVCVISETIVS